MDDDAVDADAAGKPAPPTSRAVAMFVIVFVVLGLLGAAAWFIGGGTSPTSTFCTAEALIGPNGETFGRDPGQDCQFVDLDGNVLPGQ